MRFPWQGSSKLLHRRIAALDERVITAEAHAEDAAYEAEKSRRRQERILQQVIAPLREAADHNRFADMLRKTLIDGKHGEAV